MNNNSTPESRKVNWRAALLPTDSAQPIHGHIAEISEKQIIALFPHSVPFKDGRLYIDMPDPDRKGHCYLDCKIRITNQTLVGKISQFRLFMQIIELKDEQRALLRRALKL